MSIPVQFIPAIRASIAKIRMAVGIDVAHKRILEAAVYAMADEFPELAFDQITTPDSPTLLEFFCNCVRHHWARIPGEMMSECSLTSRAIQCTFSDGAIIGIVMVYESLGVRLWEPQVIPNPNDFSEERRSA